MELIRYVTRSPVTPLTLSKRAFLASEKKYKLVSKRLQLVLVLEERITLESTFQNQIKLPTCTQMLTVVSVNSFVVEAVIMPIIGLLGLMANGASIFVLTRPQFGKTFHRLLICLSAFDSMFISKYCRLFLDVFPALKDSEFAGNCRFLEILP